MTKHATIRLKGLKFATPIAAELVRRDRPASGVIPRALPLS